MEGSQLSLSTVPFLYRGKNPAILYTEEIGPIVATACFNASSSFDGSILYPVQLAAIGIEVFFLLQSDS